MQRRFQVYANKMRYIKVLNNKAPAAGLKSPHTELNAYITCKERTSLVLFYHLSGKSYFLENFVREGAIAPFVLKACAVC